MFQRRLSLRGRFAAWTSAVVVVTTLALTYTVDSLSSSTINAQANDELNRIAASVSEALDLWLNSRQRDAVELSEREPLVAACTDRNLEEAQKLLDRIKDRSPFYENVFLADPNGKEFLDAVGGKSIGFELASVEGFRANVEHARQGEVWMSEVMKSPASGRPVALLTAPIQAGGQLVGILGTPIELSDFSDTFVKGRSIGKTGYVYMIDAAGTILAHPDAAKIMSAAAAGSDFVQQILSRKEGSLQYEYQGQDKAAQFRRARAKPWTVIATEPMAELQAGARKIQLCSLVFGLLMLGATADAVLLIGERVSRLINQVVGELNSSAEQFADAASQIAQTSQSVAQSASQQAASIEETSSAAEKVTAVTRENQKRAAALAEVMHGAQSTFRERDECMDRLAKWMTQLSESNEKVSKIVKTIDEIAFQTNILALNAAVEAARAGEAGMGFAVVADEVRSLAGRSAGAAKETSALIHESIRQSAEGRLAMQQCEEATEKTVQAARTVVELIGELDGASAEQVRGIELVSQAVSRIQHTTRETAASAEESASASQELNAQSMAVRTSMNELREMVNGQS